MSGPRAQHRLRHEPTPSGYPAKDRRATEPVILVGHSYGGAVISEAGTHEKVAALVYVTAFVPDASESVNTLLSGFPADGPQPPILPPRNGFLFLDKERFPESFAGMSRLRRRHSWPTRRCHGAWTRWADR